MPMSRNGMRYGANEVRCKRLGIVELVQPARQSLAHRDIHRAGLTALAFRLASITRERFASHIADAPFCPCISPCPANAFVEHREKLVTSKFANDLRIF